MHSITDLLLLTVNSTSRGRKASAPPPRHYSPTHRILLVGEGDFSFALALSKSLAQSPPGTILATTNEPESVVESKHGVTNLSAVRNQKCAQCAFEVDACALDRDVGGEWDRIVFQFPRVGRGGNDDLSVEENRKLVGGYFTTARRVLEPVNGRIHLALRDTPYYRKWKVDELAAHNGLRLVSKEPYESERWTALGYIPTRTNPAVREAPTSEGADLWVFAVDPKWKGDKSDLEDDGDKVMTKLERKSDRSEWAQSGRRGKRKREPGVENESKSNHKRGKANSKVDNTDKDQSKGGRVVKNRKR
ncbi:hypothetical protein BJ742DRAFT_847026 [Cladochytrium replicatum]|nr:hypothetical protein BJ742DRAFT_847026 [Cladochytrium replicatum]